MERIVQKRTSNCIRKKFKMFFFYFYFFEEIILYILWKKNITFFCLEISPFIFFFCFFFFQFIFFFLSLKSIKKLQINQFFLSITWLFIPFPFFLGFLPNKQKTFHILTGQPVNLLKYSSMYRHSFK